MQKSCLWKKAIIIMRASSRRTEHSSHKNIESSLPGNISLCQNVLRFVPLKQTLIKAVITLILHTSGTTSKPKVVPLTIAAFLNLLIISQTRCNSIQRIDISISCHTTYSHVVAVLSTVNSGGSMICSKGFDGLNFLNL